MNDATNPDYYQVGWSNGAQVVDITENLTSNGGQAVQYIARSTRLDGNNKGDVLEDLNKALWFIEREIYRLGGRGSDPILDQKMAEEAVDLDEPRVWVDIFDVPPNTVVIDRDGDRWYINADGKYRVYNPDGPYYLRDTSDNEWTPFIELKETA